VKGGKKWSFKRPEAESGHSEEVFEQKRKEKEDQNQIDWELGEYKLKE
jgi:hypothetical protein